MDWVDVTAQFQDALKRLDDGKVLMDKDWQLVDGVSVITIGDPRIDTGMAKDEPIVMQSINGINQTDTDFASVLGVFDQLLARLLLFYKGELLVATIFASTHLDAKQHELFECFKSLLFQALSLSHRLICQYGLSFEEDYDSDHSGFSLKHSSVNLEHCKVVLKKFIGKSNEDDLEYQSLYSRLSFLYHFSILLQISLSSMKANDILNVLGKDVDLILETSGNAKDMSGNL
jgi:hypothetical protein